MNVRRGGLGRGLGALIPTAPVPIELEPETLETRGAFTFDGAARYAAYKIERHTGVDIAVTPFRERHPFLAAPGAWLELRRRRRATASRADFR